MSTEVDKVKAKLVRLGKLLEAEYFDDINTLISADLSALVEIADLTRLYLAPVVEAATQFRDRTLHAARLSPSHVEMVREVYSASSEYDDELNDLGE